MKSKKLKLFVWQGFCPDYTSGLAVAVAETEEQARELVCKFNGREPYEWGTLEIHDVAPMAFSVCGGS